MPRHPQVGRSLAAISGSVFSSLAGKLATFEGEVYPFHVGDTWLEPAEGCRMQDLRVEDHPGMHRYAPPRGLPGLVSAVASRTAMRTKTPTSSDDVLISAGATGALGAALGAIVEAGDEVLILSPYWPLITGIVRCFSGLPVEVAFDAIADSPEAAREALTDALSNKTVALYINTPNNPTGQLLPEASVAACAEFCRAHDLWLISDEVYEDYAYEGEHTYARPFAPERTFSAYSFSKAYGMAGNRCGYMIGPKEPMEFARKVSTHAWYSTPTPSQLAALRVLDGRGDRWIASVRGQYRDLGRESAERLGVEPPAGSTFLFFDVRDQLDGGNLLGFLEKCADEGLFLAPGPSFGSHPTSVRICFTASPPDVTRRGVEKLARLLGR